MAAFPTGDLFWMLALTVPVLVVLLVLCTDCRDTELDTPPISDYEDNSTMVCPPVPTRLERVSPVMKTKVSNRKSSAISFLQNMQLDSLVGVIGRYLLGRHFFSLICNTPCAGTPGVVLPDVPITDQRNEDHASSDSIMDQYENMPESQRHSPGEYVNVLEPEATTLEPCFAIGANDCTSDRESEDDVPDYENVCPGL
ncbi:hypothetical protein JD844_001613 [Phrynosoma platyrhinos]|uniref:Linker for activation of T-cells family member 1 n=1 Tax=Phrynosoma platyrhinos TaxID=52577 RepID=A0ABQ7TAW2_PHRPL|nr:hypothetical protein JD844_001613 [Phrynosoma platyrhinos]